MEKINVQSEITVKIKRVHPDAVIPTYSHEGDMGMDVTAVDMKYDREHDCWIYDTGLVVEIPAGYAMLVFPRSSIRNKNGFQTNAVGIIDSGYRGHLYCTFKTIDSTNTIIKVFSLCKFVESVASDLDDYPLESIASSNITTTNSLKDKIEELIVPPYNVGERIAQVVIMPYPKVNFVEVESDYEFVKSDRGEGGHGSSGN